MDVPTRASTAVTCPSLSGGALQKRSQINNSVTYDLYGSCVHVIEYMFDNVHQHDSVHYVCSTRLESQCEFV